MMNDRPPITPALKVGALLEAYPELEEVLIAVVPAFEKLRNPVLRRTVANVTTLSQAARVGNVSIGDLVGRLRTAAGHEEEIDPETDDSESIRPDWLDTVSIKNEMDARKMIEEGGHPLPEVMGALKMLQPGEGYTLATPFVPAPMIDQARSLGYEVWTEQRGPEDFLTTFYAS